MVERFRFPYTQRQMYDLLLAACRAEVALRHREFVASDSYLRHIADVARWLTGTDTTFGLFLCGNRGNGKTTLVKAMKSLYNLLHSDEGYTSQNDCWPLFGFEIITAKELVLLAKAYNNRTRDNMSDVGRYKRLRDVEVLCIDDLGTELMTSFVHSAMYQIVNTRLITGKKTVISTNLSPDELGRRYGAPVLATLPPTRYGSIMTSVLPTVSAK